MNIEKLISLADLLDKSGEKVASDQVDLILSDLSTKDLSEMKDSVDKINEDLKTALDCINPPEQDLDRKLAIDAIMFGKLANIADRLDLLGASSEANMIDVFIQKNAKTDTFDDVIERKDGKDKQEYDADYHHSLLIREPKREQERLDLEGTDKHHVKTYRPEESNKKEAAMSSRYSPDMIGVQLARIGDDLWQCPVTGKIYDTATGFTDMSGKFHPGGSIADQTPQSTDQEIPHRVFDSRETIINRIN